MEIRSARATDAPRLTAIAFAAKGHWGYPEAWLRLWEHELTVTADDIQRHEVFLAEEEEVVFGFYVIASDAPAGELEHMWVDPDSIGRGIGSRLFAHALESAAARGVRHLRIASDPNAEAFYLGMGARRIGSVPSTPEGRRLPLLEVTIDP